MEYLAIVSRWISANYGWLHLLFCCIALIYCARKTKIAWHIPATYLFVMVLAYPVFYRELEPIEFYSAALVFDAGIVAMMALFRHPMASYISILSAACIVFHALSLLAYFWLLKLNIFGFELTPFYDAKQSHKVVIPLLESMQVVSVFVFSQPQFKHLDKPVHVKETATWQAMSVHQ
jgi:hypothetical protein